MKPPLILLKIGGVLLEPSPVLDQLLTDFSRLPGAKVLVHGGGKKGTEIATKLDIPVQIVDGRRITDTPMLEVAIMVYGGLMNKQLVAQLQANGVNALGMTGADMNIIRANKRPVKKIDYGWVGDITAVNTAHLKDLLLQDILPVLAPLTHDGKGQLLNTNADTIAARVAHALAVDFEVHLIYCLDKPGVMMDPEDPATVIPKINPAVFARLQQEGIVAGGMIPKLQNAFDALAAGVRKVYLCRPEAVGKVFVADFGGTVIQGV